MKKSNQLSLNENYADRLESIENDKPEFLSLLEEHLDVDALDSLLIIFLTYSRELREFCCIDKVLDASRFKHFKAMLKIP